MTWMNLHVLMNTQNKPLFDKKNEEKNGLTTMGCHHEYWAESDGTKLDIFGMTCILQPGSIRF